MGRSMRRVRVIPTLLLDGEGIVKTVKFSKPRYIGDPINSVRLFNEKEVDELFFLDITATPNKQVPNYDLIAAIASECFMPLAYGGGITTLAQIDRLFTLGIEKIVLNSAIHDKPTLIEQASKKYGAQAIVASIDVKKGLFGGYKVLTRSGKKNTHQSPAAVAVDAQRAGAGEILLQSIDKEGTFTGFDIPVIKQIANTVELPVVASGGASTMDDFKHAINLGGASAVAAGSMFVYQGVHNAVLINYPSQKDLVEGLYSKLQ